MNSKNSASSNATGSQENRSPSVTNADDKKDGLNSQRGNDAPANAEAQITPNAPTPRQSKDGIAKNAKKSNGRDRAKSPIAPASLAHATPINPTLGITRSATREIANYRAGVRSTKTTAKQNCNSQAASSSIPAETDVVSPIFTVVSEDFPPLPSSPVRPGERIPLVMVLPAKKTKTKKNRRDNADAQCPSQVPPTAPGQWNPRYALQEEKQRMMYLNADGTEPGPSSALPRYIPSLAPVRPPAKPARQMTIRNWDRNADGSAPGPSSAIPFADPEDFNETPSSPSNPSVAADPDSDADRDDDPAYGSRKPTGKRAKKAGGQKVRPSCLRPFQKVEHLIRLDTPKTRNQEVTPSDTNPRFMDMDEERRSQVEVVNKSEERSNDYMQKCSKLVLRKYFVYDPSSGKAKYLPGAKDTCIICDGGAYSKKEALVQCHGRMSGRLNERDLPFLKQARHDCRSKFHVSCLLTYNHGDLDAQYAAQPECEGKLLCPLHACEYCNISHKRQSAYFPNLLVCVVCFRATHPGCKPAGAKVIPVKIDTEQGEKIFNMMICSSHARAEKYGKAHLNKCCNLCCKRGDYKLHECTTCCASFHKECFETKQAVKDEVDSGRCENCQTNYLIPIDSMVMALKDDNSFAPGSAHDWEKLPDTFSQRLREDVNFNREGFIPVCFVKRATWSIIPSSQIAHLTSVNLPVKNRQVKDLEDKYFNLDAARFPTVSRKVNNFSEELFFSDDVTPADLAVKGRYEKCDCAVGNEGSCKGGTGVGCINFTNFTECSGKCVGCTFSFASQCQNHILELFDTGDRGLGVRTVDVIGKMLPVIQYTGNVIREKEMTRRARLIDLARDDQPHLYTMTILKGLAVDATNIGNLASRINHSCNPNCSVKLVNVREVDGAQNETFEARLYVCSLRKLNREEELTIDYGFTTSQKCVCKEINCAGLMGGAVQKATNKKSQRKRNGSKASRNAAKKAKTNGSVPVPVGAFDMEPYDLA